MIESLNTDQIKDAIDKAMTKCDEHMPNYDPVSMRSILEELGYSKKGTDDIIRYVAKNGFNYCLDPMIEATHFDPNNRDAPKTGPMRDMVTDKPPYSACFWGPDQLKSRLWGVR